MGNWSSSNNIGKLKQPLLTKLEDTYLFEETTTHHHNNTDQYWNILEARIENLEKKSNENFLKIQNHSCILRDDLHTLVNNQLYLEKRIKSLENELLKNNLKFLEKHHNNNIQYLTGGVGGPIPSSPIDYDYDNNTNNARRNLYQHTPTYGVDAE